jgi:AraC-like DNA-binding protein
MSAMSMPAMTVTCSSSRQPHLVTRTRIARRSHDPEFDLTDAARNLGLSRRYIQRLLEGTGKSFTEHVLEWRLQRVHAMLIDSRYEHMAIIDIALASGFSDVSHFNHMFRQRFGAAPSSVRANALGPNKS